MASQDPRKNRKKPRPDPVEAAVSAAGRVSPADPLGMYTGRPRDEKDMPTQDADDL